MANYQGLEKAIFSRYEYGFPTLGQGKHTWYSEKSGGFGNRLASKPRSMIDKGSPLHAKVVGEETVFMDARDILEEEVKRLEGRADGGRPFFLTNTFTQSSPQTHTPQRRDSIDMVAFVIDSWGDE